ncbi:MAG: type II toxin-antitoxin system RelE/ParE family toxin [Candidatus Desulforudis sp.]|nr:type II toxin-antitoxin system RelE/ParE family toxin [Desulforudis sp.]
MSGKTSVYEVHFSAKAVKQLKALDPQVQRRIKGAVRKLEVFPPAADVARVRTRKGVYRLRVGDWRVFYSYKVTMRQVVIIAIRPRERAYD